VATLSVWRFDDPAGAGRGEQILLKLQEQKLIEIHDAAIVSWPIDRKRPKTRQLHNIKGDATLEGSFWGLLFGLLFFVRLFGVAVGAAMGLLTGSLTDVGIDDDFIEGVRSEVQPGTSALFVLSSHAVTEAVRDAFAEEKPHLIHSNLSQADEERLREYFGME
jgi:uncharacterized membrane protein